MNEHDSDDSSTPDEKIISGCLAEIGDLDFASWYRERQAIENIRDGNAERNTPSPPPEPAKHHPSRLLQCHRKLYYRDHNAPEESRDPHGVFWIGSQIETDVIESYLRNVADRHDGYVSNSEWAAITVETASERLKFAGVTDPVIVNRDGEPLLVSEVKTTSSLDVLDGSRPHHRAQAHAYMRSLEAEYDRPVRDAVIIYVERESFAIRTYQEAFDAPFWEETVLPWAAQLTEYRRTEALPPGDPEYDWECKYCSYRERCGKGNAPVADSPPVGFIPGVDYPRAKVREHLAAYDEVKLPPTLAHAYPEIADSHEVADWRCPSCEITVAWDAVDWDSTADAYPFCPLCRSDGYPNELVCPWGTEDESWERLPEAALTSEEYH